MNNTISSSSDLQFYNTTCYSNADIQKLNFLIDEIEKSLDNYTWSDRLTWSGKPLSLYDKHFMPDLIALANKRKPGLNLMYVSSPHDLSDLLKNRLMNDYSSHKYMISTGDDKVHFALLETRYINDTLSMILFEPTSLNHLAPGMLLLRIMGELERHGIHNKNLFTLQMDVQRSDYECGIFCLAFAKKMHKTESDILLLHEKVLKDSLKGTNFEESKKIADEFLPLYFYKHTQGLGRLGEYLDTNSEPLHKNISKKDYYENLIKKKYVEVNNKLMSKSIYVKRLDEYKALRVELLRHDHLTAADFKKSAPCIEITTSEETTNL